MAHTKCSWVLAFCLSSGEIGIIFKSSPVYRWVLRLFPVFALTNSSVPQGPACLQATFLEVEFLDQRI